MSNKIGRKTRVGIGPETTPGTGVSAVDWFLIDVADAFNTMEHTADNSALGVLNESHKGRKTKIMSEFNLEGNIGNLGIGHLLKGCLGASGAANLLESGVYSHTFNELNTNNKPSFSLYLNDDDVSERAVYSMVNTLELNLVAGAKGRFKSQFYGRALVDSASSPTITSESELDTQDLSLEYADTYSDLGTGTSFNVKEFNILFENNVQDYLVNGSNNPDVFYNRTFKITGSFTMSFQDDTFKDFVEGDSTRAIRIHLENPSSLIGATEFPSLTIDLAKCSFTNFEPGRDMDDLVTQTISFQAEYSIEDALTCQAILVNNRSTDY